MKQGRRYGVEFKLSNTPRMSRSIRTAISELGLEHLWVVYPGDHHFPLEERVSVVGLRGAREEITRKWSA
jgi:hypothetical protein